MSLKFSISKRNEHTSIPEMVYLLWIEAVHGGVDFTTQPQSRMDSLGQRSLFNS